MADMNNHDTVLWARDTLVLFGLCSMKEAQDLDIPTAIELADECERQRLAAVREMLAHAPALARTGGRG
jgi:hypothetical protein